MWFVTARPFLRGAVRFVSCRAMIAWFHCKMGYVKTMNRVDSLVVGEKHSSRIIGHTTSLSRTKRAMDWKNDIRVTRSHGKHVICRGHLMNGRQRAENEDSLRSDMKMHAIVQAIVKQFSGQWLPVFIGSILKYKKRKYQDLSLQYAQAFFLSDFLSETAAHNSHWL